MTMSIKVMLADDHSMIREGLKQLLEFDGSIQVIAQAGDGEECLKKLCQVYPDVLLLDINMPKKNGIEVLQEIRDKATMEAAIETAESGHLVIGTLHTKSCAETIDRMLNFYDISDQTTVKYLLSSLLKLVIAQRLLPGKDGKLVLVPEVMVVDNIVSGLMRKEKLSVSEIEDAIQSNSENGSIGLINSIAQLFVDDKITLEQAKSQIEEKNIEILNRTIMQLRIKRDRGV